MAQAGVGLIVHHGLALTLESANEIYFRASAANVTISFWSEIDVG
jgi:hypothetical protein